MPESSHPHLPAAIFAVRLLGLIFLLLGLWQGTANLIDGWMEFDPSYLGYFLRSQLLRPVIALLLGMALIAGSRPLARRLTHGLS